MTTRNANADYNVATPLKKPNYVRLFRRMWHRVEVWQPNQTPNAAGGVDTQYTLTATVWCDIEPINEEGMTGRWVRDVQVDDVPTHRITVRNIPSIGVTRYNITRETRMVLEQDQYTDRVFHVLSVNEIDDRGWVLIINLREIFLARSADGLLNP